MNNSAPEWTEGLVAAWALYEKYGWEGAKYEDNPYVEDTAEHRAWRDGFNTAWDDADSTREL